ncbi:lipopolysaccharide biosynthesis protein [uncultured Robinsoniella sp.]|uniref:lipopolysaccharide biosynthesis protein n=1 Tax=uncultured Robinsoniella sp. TaxID=904190 RepID=UPI00374F2E86
MSSEAEKSRSLLVGTIIYAIGNFGTKILSFLIVPLYTYYIEPSDMGNLDLINTTVSLLSPLITMKISDAAYKWMIQDESNNQDYISAAIKLLFRNCLFCIIFLCILKFFVPIWKFYYFLPMLIMDRILECFQKLLRGLKKQKLYAVTGILYTAIYLLLNVIRVVYFNQGVTALLQNSIISQVIVIIVILLFEKRIRNIKILNNYKKLQHEMLSYSIPLVPSALNWWVMSASDRYIIKFFLGSAANGIYAVAYKFPSVLSTIFAMFNNSWTDMILSDMDTDNNSKDYYTKIFEQFYRLSFGLILVLIPATKIVTNLILSEAYKTASTYIAFLYLGTVFQGFSSFYSVGYLRGGKTKRAATTSIYGAVVNILIDLFFIKYLGLFAAALSTFLGFFTMWIMRVKDTKGVLPIEIHKIRFLLYLIACIVLSCFMIISEIKIEIILFIILLIWFMVDNKKMLRSIIRKMINRKK